MPREKSEVRTDASPSCGGPTLKIAGLKRSTTEWNIFRQEYTRWRSPGTISVRSGQAQRKVAITDIARVRSKNAEGSSSASGSAVGPAPAVTPFVICERSGSANIRAGCCSCKVIRARSGANAHDGSIVDVSDCSGCQPTTRTTDTPSSTNERGLRLRLAIARRSSSPETQPGEIASRPHLLRARVLK